MLRADALDDVATGCAQGFDARTPRADPVRGEVIPRSHLVAVPFEGVECAGDDAGARTSATSAREGGDATQGERAPVEATQRTVAVVVESPRLGARDLVIFERIDHRHHHLLRRAQDSASPVRVNMCSCEVVE